MKHNNLERMQKTDSVKLQSFVSAKDNTEYFENILDGMEIRGISFLTDITASKLSTQNLAKQ